MTRTVRHSTRLEGRYSAIFPGYPCSAACMGKSRFTFAHRSGGRLRPLVINVSAVMIDIFARQRVEGKVEPRSQTSAGALVLGTAGARARTTWQLDRVATLTYRVLACRRGRLPAWQLYPPPPSSAARLDRAMGH